MSYLHVLGDDKDGSVLGADSVQLDEVVVLQLRHDFGLLDEVVLRHRSLLHHLHCNVDRSLPLTPSDYPELT